MPLRLTLVIHSLADGGAERVMAMMANHWAEEANDVTLITFDSQQNDSYRLADEINRIGLGLMRESRNLVQALCHNVERLRQLRRAIRDSKPDKVVSFTDKTNVTTLLACLGLRVDVVVAERIDPRHHQIGRIWSMLRRLVYARCFALVVQTESVRESLRRCVGRKPIYVIPNAVEEPGKLAENLDQPHREGHCVLAMGRLVPQKGFDLLIDAFARIAAKHADWTLHILGQGPQRAELERFIRAQNLQSRVRLHGWVSEPGTLLRPAELFVLSSLYEGFPNALLEAMACRLAVISFDCESGPAEIIRHEIDGLLVPAGNVTALSQAMDWLMSDETERQRLGSRAQEVTERFSVDLFFRRWNLVLRGADENEFPEHVEQSG
jgi:glycosyltransferase involved in cell wall biosynthesis